MEDISEIKSSKKADKVDVINDDDNISEESTPLNLSCLFSPNWLNDEIIDNYRDLLHSFDSEVFMFTTYFYQKFAEESFEGVNITTDDLIFLTKN